MNTINTINTIMTAITLTNSTKFESLTISDFGLVIQHEKKTVTEISYSELDKIFIKVYKLKPIYTLLFILFPMMFAFLCFEYFKLNIEMSVALLPVIPAFEKINRFKRFGFILILKDGTVFKKHISLKIKSDTVELINEVKKKCLQHNTF